MELSDKPITEISAKPIESASHEERKSRKPKRNASQTKTGDGSRYFLAAEGSGRDNAPLVLGEEFESEDEVLIASLKKDAPFYRVETWRAHAEKKGRNMVLRKRS
jgi:hypothetical protein